MSQLPPSYIRSDLRLPQIVSSGAIPHAADLVSGHIGSGQITVSHFTGIASGQFMSGLFTSTWPCEICHKDIKRGEPHFRAICIEVSISPDICAKCAGYNLETGAFYSRRDAIRESIPQFSGAPMGIVCDFLRDNNRVLDADYLKDNFTEDALL